MGRRQGELAAAALNPQDPADRELVEAIRALVTRITFHPKGDRSDALAFDLVLHGDQAHFTATPGRKFAGAACSGPSGSWGRDRTADLWVMNPPL